MKLAIGAIALTLGALPIAPAVLAQETHAATAQTAEGNGVVTAINPAASTITIRHEAIPALRWPAMTMSFTVQSPSLLAGVSAGARVHFTLTNHNGHIMISAIHVRQ